jgi:monovalent cation:H+ antiporter-2, CPA2 family
VPPAAPPFLVEVAILIVAGAAVAYVGYRLGLVPIVGFLLTGVLIGPHGLALVRDPAMVDALAEVGVILLLFTIGIAFSLEKLARIRRVVLLGGAAQVVGTTALAAGIGVAFGLALPVAVFTGFLVAMSSTTILLKVLEARGEVRTRPGEVAVGVSLFQDLASVGMILLLPALAGQGGSAGDVAWALLKAAGVIALVLIGARRLMPPLLEVVARTCSQELFLLTVIALCFGTAWLSALAGVSVALGAFLAGLVVSESRYSAHAFGETMPLQILFSATFFVSVGMLLDVRFLAAYAPLVGAVVLGVLVLKTLTGVVAARLLGDPLPVALASSLLLAQVGEFSFVLERAGRAVGLYPGGSAALGGQVLIAATVLLMVATPGVTALGSRWAARSTPPRRPEPSEPPAEEAAPLGLRDHVVIAGYGPGARRLAAGLRQQGAEVVVITLSPERAVQAEASGLAVVRGHPARQHALEAAGLAEARALLVPDDPPEAAAALVRVARRVAPGVPVVVRVPRAAEAGALREAGVDRVVVEELEGMLGLAERVLSGDALRDLREASYAEALRPDDGGLGDRGLDRGLDATSPPLVTVYGADWCALTSGFRTYLRRREIPFTYRNVEEDPEAEAAVRAMNGGALKFPMVVTGSRALKNPTLDELETALRAEGVAAEAPSP